MEPASRGDIHPANAEFAGHLMPDAPIGTLADSHVVDALRGFTSRHRVEVDLRTATSREVSALVRSGEVDLGVCYHRPTPASNRSHWARSGSTSCCHRVTAGWQPDLGPLRDEKGLGLPAERIRDELRIGGLRTVEVSGVDAGGFLAVLSAPGSGRRRA
jgi:DNA-binding transcriptional LysR family regulator